MNLNDVWTAFCRCAEAQELTLGMKNILARASIFEFTPDSMTNALERARDPNVDHSFLLPFDEMALIDEGGVVLLYDINRDGGVKPVNNVALDIDPSVGPRKREMNWRACVKAVTFHAGTKLSKEGFGGIWAEGISYIGENDVGDLGNPRTEWLHEFQPAKLCGMVDNRLRGLSQLLALIGKSYEQMANDAYRDYSNSLQAAIDELSYATQPFHYLIEETPPLNRPVQWKRGKQNTVVDDGDRVVHRTMIPRWMERPKVRYIRPDAVHHVRPVQHEVGDETKRKRKPHVRSAYYRILRSERYRNMRGKAIFIRPHWVGEKEWTHERMRYRVVSG